MYIRNKPAAALYKLLLGALSLGLEWFLLAQYGFNALRLFPAWVLFVSAIYFLASALILALTPDQARKTSQNQALSQSQTPSKNQAANFRSQNPSRHFSGKNPCPVCEGVIIVAFFLMSAMAIASHNHHLTLPELDSWFVFMLALALPLLTLLDWLLFVKKGRLQPMMPFYWLALPVTYMATMIFTAEVFPESTALLYPLPLFNVREFGFLPMLETTLSIVALILIIGCIIYLLDFVMSGKLAKYVVLPHLRVVEVDEHGKEITPPQPEIEIPTYHATKKSKPASAKPAHLDTKSVRSDVKTAQPDQDIIKPAQSDRKPASQDQGPIIIKVTSINDDNDKPSDNDNNKPSTKKSKPPITKKSAMIKMQNKFDYKPGNKSNSRLPNKYKSSTNKSNKPNKNKSNNFNKSSNQPKDKPNNHNNPSKSQNPNKKPKTSK